MPSDTAMDVRVLLVVRVRWLADTCATVMYITQTQVLHGAWS